MRLWLLVLALLAAACEDHTDPPGWGQPVRLGPEESGARAFAYYPTIRADALGHALAAWREDVEGPSGPLERIRAARFQPRAGWQRAETLGDNATGELGEAAMAMNRSGDAVIVWWQSIFNLQAARFAPDRGWTRETSIPVPGTVARLQVALSEERRAVAVWSDPYVTDPTAGFGAVLRGAILSPATGWSAVQNVSTHVRWAGRIPGITSPQLAVVGEDALALWIQRPSGSGSSLWFNRAAAGFGWDAPETITPSIDADVQVAATGSGHALAMWYSGARPHASFYSGASWSAPELIPGDGGGRGCCSAVGMNEAGVAMFLRPGEQSGVLEVMRFDSKLGWGAPTPVWLGSALPDGDLGLSGSASPAIAVDAAGNAMVAWPAKRLLAIRFDVARGWEPPQVIQVSDAYPVEVHLAGDGAGNVFAVWKDFDSALWANRFVAPAR